ncbi:unnamed protein product, partial [Acanthoscelides obtectus]
RGPEKTGNTKLAGGLVCYHSPRRLPPGKSVDCYFFKNSYCKKGQSCRYRHPPPVRSCRDGMTLGRGSVTRMLAPSVGDRAGLSFEIDAK